MGPGDFRLFVGLGNPGAKYINTRHNIGFMALDRLAKQKSSIFKKQDKLHGFLADIGIGDNKLRLLMPNTFMNDSGRSIRATLDWFGIGIDQMLVVVDDLDLPLGKIRLRTQGSAGGHNGLRSTIDHLGTQAFSRLRIGIGSPNCLPEEKRRKTISHVLGTFRSEEEFLLEEVLNEVLVGFELLQRVGLEKASNRINAFKSESCA